MEIIIWTLARVERETGSDEWGNQGQGRVRRDKGERKEELLEGRRNRKSERTEEHLSGLSSLKQFATWGRYKRHKKIDSGGAHKNCP